MFFLSATSHSSRSTAIPKSNNVFVENSTYARDYGGEDGELGDEIEVAGRGGCWHHWFAVLRWEDGLGCGHGIDLMDDLRTTAMAEINATN
jgi:hypothetical protein